MCQLMTSIKVINLSGITFIGAKTEHISSFHAGIQNSELQCSFTATFLTAKVS